MFLLVQKLLSFDDSFIPCDHDHGAPKPMSENRCCVLCVLDSFRSQVKPNNMVILCSTTVFIKNTYLYIDML